MLSVRSSKLSGANSSVSDGASADANWRHADPELEVHNVFIVCLYEVDTHTHAHERKNKR